MYHMVVIQEADDEEVIIPIPNFTIEKGLGNINVQVQKKSLTNIIVSKTLAHPMDVKRDQKFAASDDANAQNEAYWLTKDQWTIVSTLTSDGFATLIQAPVTGLRIKFTGAVADGPGIATIAAQ